MALWEAFSIVVAVVALAEALPTISFPLNSQLPPVARISETFSFTFSSNTFASTLPMTYTLDGPQWLSLDTSSRTLSGTPSTSDGGTAPVTIISFGLIASDSEGSVTLNASLAVSSNPAPTVNIPAIGQLEEIGAFSPPSTVLYHPATAFSFSFNLNTFSLNGGTYGLSYYALTADNTPLPAWIKFDGTSLSFNGQTPDYTSLIQPPQTFGLQLVATDVVGFTGVSMHFEMEVGIHLLAFNDALVVLNATIGDTVSYNGILGNLELDGNAAVVSDIATATAQLPAWMTFNNSTLALAGIVSADATPYNVTVQITDIYGDIADTTIFLDVSEKTNDTFFLGVIGVLNATIGSNFSYDLSPYLLNKTDTNVIAVFPQSDPWLSFDPQSFILSGDVPSTAVPSIVGISLDATSKLQHTSASQNITISLLPPTRKPSTSTALLSSTQTSRISKTATATPTASLIPSEHHSKFLKPKVILAIFIPVGILALGLLLAIVCCLCRRRTAKKRHGAPSKSEISMPIQDSPMSSVEEIILPPPVPPLRPLTLDKSVFGGVRRSQIISQVNTAPLAAIGAARPTIRRSQTMSATETLDAQSQPHLSESASMGNRSRSLSVGALTQSDRNWRITQMSSDPTIRTSQTSSSEGAQRLSRAFSNYSRKGHTSRSAMVFPVTVTPVRQPLRERESTVSSHPTSTTNESILNLTSSEFSSTPIEKFSVLPKHIETTNDSESKYPGTPDNHTTSPTRLTSKRRPSRLVPGLARPPSALGHGKRPSSSLSFSSSGDNWKRRSVGGHGSMSLQNAVPNAKDFLSPTISSHAFSHIRGSKASALSATSIYSDDPKDPFVKEKYKPTIKTVMQSPTSHSTTFSVLSNNSRHSRPVSRCIGSSPFFGGSSFRSSHRSPRFSTFPSRYSNAFDSPTVPEEEGPEMHHINLEATIRQELREDSQSTKEGSRTPRDSFGINYGAGKAAAKDGTKALKSYIQSQLRRKRTNETMNSSVSRDSRFDDPENSFLAHDPITSPLSPENFDGRRSGVVFGSDAGWEAYGPLNDTWQTVGRDNSPVLPRTLFRNRGSRSTPTTPDLSNLGPNARVVEGAQRRPLSVDACNRPRKNSRRARVEEEGELVGFNEGDLAFI